MSLWLIRTCVLASAVLLGAGLAGPCMEIRPAFGAMDGWVRLLKPAAAAPTRYSVLGGVLALLRNGSTVVGLTVFVFSVIFPAAKLALTASATAALASGRSSGALVRLAHHAGKFSMLDVFVVGLIVLAIKGLPGGSQVVLGWGVAAFAASVVLSLVASLGVARAERRLGKAARGTPASTGGVSG